MIEQLKKGILTGIGLGLMTNEKILEFARKSAEEAKLSTEEARKLADELLEQSEEAKKKLEDKIDEQIKQQFDRMGLATKEDVAELKKEILKLHKGQKKQKKVSS